MKTKKFKQLSGENEINDKLSSFEWKIEGIQSELDDLERRKQNKFKFRPEHFLFIFAGISVCLQSLDIYVKTKAKT